MEETAELTLEDKLTAFSQQVNEDYQKIDSEQNLELVLDKEHLDLILTVGFGIPYHKVSLIRTDGKYLKLKLEKI
jgi:hypothetical protein